VGISIIIIVVIMLVINAIFIEITIFDVIIIFRNLINFFIVRMAVVILFLISFHYSMLIIYRIKELLSFNFKGFLLFQILILMIILIYLC